MIVALLAVAGLLSWALILHDWKLGLRLLVLSLPFLGAVILLTHGDVLAHLAKDLLFVLPIYLAFAIRGVSRRDWRLPPLLVLSILFLAALVIGQMANPRVANIAVALVGAKVWLFYVPLLVVTAVATSSDRDALLLLRSMVALVPVPCLVGLGQYLGSSTVGHEETITAFYGEAASGATQGFSSFYYGGQLYRLPSTFQSVSHYFGYIEHSIVPAYAILRSDPSRAWRRFAAAMLLLLVTAGLLSGARSAFVFIPALLVLILVLDRVLVGAMIWVVAVPTLFLLVLSLAGLDPFVVFAQVQTLGHQYATGLVVSTVVDAASRFPWGLGTGMNTNAARHVLSGDARLVGFESQYAKAITELGIAGCVAMTAVFACMASCAWTSLKKADSRWRSTGAALAAYYLILPIHALKGWPLDWEPANVYYWMFGGIMLTLPALAPAPQPRRTRPLEELWLRQRQARGRAPDGKARAPAARRSLPVPR